MREGRGSRRAAVALALALASASTLLAAEPSQSPVSVVRDPDGSMRITTPTSEFDVSRSGAVRASLLANGRHLALEGGAVERGGGSRDPWLRSGSAGDLVLDWDHARVTEASGSLGSRGKRVEAKGRTRIGLEATVGLEVYDDFPTLALRTLELRNAGPKPVRLDEIVTERHSLAASLVGGADSAHALWSFHGASADWGQDEIVPLSQGFSRANRMAAPLPNGVGGGIPVVAFWSASVGIAIGHLEPAPRVLSLPVLVEGDGHVSVAMVLEPKLTLAPGAVYRAPRSFVAVFTGDFYEPLRLYSTALQRQGWTLPKPTEESFAASWCGWGYEANVTLPQMLGIVPKLEAVGIRRATLDYRWFSRYGSWDARSDTWPGRSIQDVVSEYHKRGIKVQLWWMPLAAEAGPSPLPSSEGAGPGVATEHPEWLVLDPKGRPARMTFSVAPKEPLAILCPALAEVQEYYRQIARRFIGEWGFDGHKLDYAYSVPACYNPRHHHASPEDSIAAMGEVYRAIFETTRALKPDAVTQICPCGTPPNLAWLPYMDQAVTADPVGSVQVRRRIKMYKALLGPEAAVYGDHVELSEVRRQGGKEVDSGTDFASTVGVGGVPGTKFVLAGADPEFRSLFLTPERESHWKKWLGLYNTRLLSQGTFLNLYTYGFDAPEGYAIRKDGAMYYAFYLPPGAPRWEAGVELRGLEPGRYRVTDYANGKDLGWIDGRTGHLEADFARELLLEARPE